MVVYGGNIGERDYGGGAADDDDGASDVVVIGQQWGWVLANC